MTDIPLPATGSTNWTGWAAEQENLSDKVRNLAFTNVKDYGALGNGTTDDAAAVNAAVAAVPNGGMVVFPGGSTYKIGSSIAVPPGVIAIAYGADINHTGTGTLFDLNNSGGFNLDEHHGVLGGRITGTSTGGAAIELGNAYGQFIRDVDISGYTTGTGIWLNNQTNWTEGASLSNVMVNLCKTGVKFSRNGGTNSFAYTDIQSVAINVPASGVGIDLGVGSSTDLYIYNAKINATIWINGNNAVAVDWGALTTMDNSALFITGETFNSPTGHKALYNRGGTIKAFGHVNIKGASHDLALGETRVLAAGVIADSRSGSGGGTTFQSLFTENPDTGHDATIGYATGSGFSAPFVAGYNGGGDVFRAYATPFGATPSGADLRFAVESNGDTRIGGAWNNGRMKLGAYYLWIDATGRLRIKNSAPSSDTDGTVVGTQT